MVERGPEELYTRSEIELSMVSEGLSTESIERIFEIARRLHDHRQAEILESLKVPGQPEPVRDDPWL